MVSAMMVLDLGFEEGLAPRTLHHLVGVPAELARVHLGELLEGEGPAPPAVLRLLEVLHLASLQLLFLVLLNLFLISVRNSLTKPR